MADNCAISLLGAMDRLWFHQIIVFSLPTSLLLPNTLKTPQSVSETESFKSLNVSQQTLTEEEIPSTASATTLPEDDCNNQQGDDDEDDQEKEIKPNPKKPTKLDPITSKFRSHSTSPLHHFHQKRPRSYSGSVMRLQKTMSCKTLAELELEEVKGFIDLGFKFSKDQLNPRMMRVVPGLQRIGLWETGEDKSGISSDGDEVIEEEEEEEEEGEEERGGVMRPYLSEAWIVERPDSPLLNLRLPRVSAADEMKRHIRCWARTVASVIRRES